MKKIFLIIFFAAALNSVAVVANSSKEVSPANTHLVAKARLSQKDVDNLEARLYQIRDMDKSHLSLKQKRELRAEVKAIKAKLSNQVGGGVYLSGAAILILIVLLIIFI